MKVYLDMSLVVASLAHENSSERVQAWLEAQEAEDWAISDWVLTEVSSALSMKIRTGQISIQERTLALAQFQRMRIDSLTVFAVTSWHFVAAARYVDHYQSGLRSADALHVAICADQGAKLCTLDRRLAVAAPTFGVATESV